MSTRVVVVSVIFALCGGFKVHADILYDNGLPTGAHGFANGSENVFGSNRAVLDDFVIPADQIWRIDGFQWLHAWNTLDPGVGASLSLEFRRDDHGTPGELVAIANIRNYTEHATGDVSVGRPEAISLASLDPVLLSEGTYWLRANVIGPESNFWLLRRGAVGSEFWFDGGSGDGFFSSNGQFGPPAVPHDLNFVLLGRVVPEPNAVAIISMFCIATLQRRKRRRKG